jgi:hypothetical protein|tara:strand:+ start:2595 stop:2768 length:174 start_codon:yes stop_codon:yes gene_type:complete
MIVEVDIYNGDSEVDYFGIRVYQPRGENVWYVTDKSEGALWEFDNLADAMDKAESIY